MNLSIFVNKSFVSCIKNRTYNYNKEHIFSLKGKHTQKKIHSAFVLFHTLHFVPFLWKGVQRFGFKYQHTYSYIHIHRYVYVCIHSEVYI